MAKYRARYGKVGISCTRFGNQIDVGRKVKRLGADHPSGVNNTFRCLFSFILNEKHSQLEAQRKQKLQSIHFTNLLEDFLPLTIITHMPNQIKEFSHDTNIHKVEMKLHIQLANVHTTQMQDTGLIENSYQFYVEAEYAVVEIWNEKQIFIPSWVKTFN